MTLALNDSVKQAVALLKSATPTVPAAAVVLGSGVDVLNDLAVSQTISYQQAFGLSSGVSGHAGILAIGQLEGKPIAVLRGRFHLYEGHNWATVTLITRVLVDWGVPWLFLTNAAGGLNQTFNIGDLMVLTGYRDLLNPKYRATGLLPALRENNRNCGNQLTQQLFSIGKKLSSEDKSFRPLKSGVYAGML